MLVSLQAGAADVEAAAVIGQSRKRVEHSVRQAGQRKLATAAVLE